MTLSMLRSSVPFRCVLCDFIKRVPGCIALSEESLLIFCHCDIESIEFYHSSGNLCSKSVLQIVFFVSGYLGVLHFDITTEPLR